MAATCILLILAGVCVGVLSGLLGIGGGLVMVPLLRLGFGFDAYISSATSLFAIIPTSLSGTIQHIRNSSCVPKLGIALGIGGAVTSSLGVYLGSISPTWAIMLVAAIVMVYSAYTMLRKAIRTSRKKSNNQKGGASVTSGANESFELTRNRLLGGFGIGLLAGFFSGYVGVGGGFVMVPLMTAWLGVPMKKASGTSLIAIIILAIPGVIEQIMFGHVDYLAGVALCVGAIPGAVLGARLVPRVPDRTLRFIFAGLLAVAGIALVANEFLY